MQEAVHTLEDTPLLLCENVLHNHRQVLVDHISLLFDDAIQRVVHNVVCSGCRLLDEPYERLEIWLCFAFFLVLSAKVLIPKRVAREMVVAGLSDLGLINGLLLRLRLLLLDEGALIRGVVALSTLALLLSRATSFLLVLHLGILLLPSLWFAASALALRATLLPVTTI